MHHFQAVIVVMLVVVMLSCLGDLPAAAVGPPVLFLVLLVQALACINESKIESIFQSIVQSMVQSRVQSPGFTPSHWEVLLPGLDSGFWTGLDSGFWTGLWTGLLFLVVRAPKE